MVERIERTYRGISARAAVHYLLGLGGETRDDGTVVGDGWRADVSAERVPVGPTLELTEVTVRFETDGDGGADDRSLEALVETFSQKAMRAGG